MTTKDIKTFRLKARGDPGSCKTELLIAFGRIAKSFGMETALSLDGHDMHITSTKEERSTLYDFNRSSGGLVRALDPRSPPDGNGDVLLSVIHADIQNARPDIPIDHRNVVLTVAADAIRRLYPEPSCR